MSLPRLTLNTSIQEKNKALSSNQIRLAAVSNYKLAQLTFAPPDNVTLRKTALIKNLVDVIYRHALNDNLSKQMMRWEYFTPESLEDMTQKDVEKIIYRYSRLIYSTAISLERDGIKKDQQFLCSDYDAERNEFQDEMSLYYASLFSHPNSVFSKDTYDAKSSTSSSSSSSLSDNEEDSEEENIEIKYVQERHKINLVQESESPEIEHISASPTKLTDYLKTTSYHPNSYIRHNSNDSIGENNKTTSRLSWLSDTGVPTSSSTVSPSWASELMTLFDMEFNVDLSLNSLHDLKKLENTNGSSTSLSKVFSADECYDDDDDEENKNEIEVEEIGSNNNNNITNINNLSGDYCSKGRFNQPQFFEQKQVYQEHMQFEKEQELEHEETSLNKSKEKSNKKAVPPIKVFNFIPALKHLGSKHSQKKRSNSADSVDSSSSESTKAPVTPTHQNTALYTAHELPAPPSTEHKLPQPPTKASNYCYYASSSSSSEGEDDDDTEEDSDDDDDDDDETPQRMTYDRIGAVRRVIPPGRSSSLSHRLQEQYMQSDSDEDNDDDDDDDDDDSSVASSSFFNDSVDTFQVEMNYSRDSAGGGAPSIKGFLKSFGSRRGSKAESVQSTQSSGIASADYNVPDASKFDGTSFDTFSISSKKRKNSLKKMTEFLSGGSKSAASSIFSRRGSTASSVSNTNDNSKQTTASNLNQNRSATSTMMSSSSVFSDDMSRHRYTPPSSPVALNPKTAERHGVYTTSMVSETSSFNWNEEVRQRTSTPDEYSSVRSHASSNTKNSSKTMSSFFNSDQKESKHRSRSSSSSSLGSFLKRITSFNKKDKNLQRA